MNGTWSFYEDEHYWQLFFLPSGQLMPLQVLKAPKINQRYAPYWPNEKETKFILEALNKLSSDKPLKANNYEQKTA